MSAVLEARGLVARHGLLTAVHEVSFDLAQGEALALVGANGAGKTTLLRAIAGAHPIAAGSVLLEGNEITNLAAHRRVGLGIALVPEGRRLFPEMTVRENLLVAGGRARAGASGLDAVLAAFPMLPPLLRRRAGSLSGGEQQATAIARAMMTNPRVLLVDEASLGLSPVAVDAVYESLRTLKRNGTTTILVEQGLDRALEFADRVLCLREGRVVLTSSTSEAIREAIVTAYFGRAQTVAASS